MDALLNLFVYLWGAIKKGFPVIILIVGFGLSFYGIFGEIENTKIAEALKGAGHILIVSCVFTFLSKWLQFSGLIRDEITKFIFEPKFLANRKDLPEYWEKVSKELFDNKFPEISVQLLKDVKERYMPTAHLMYYDEAETTIDISYKPDGFVEITQTSKLTAIPKDGKAEYSYDFGVVIPYHESIDGSVSYEVTVKVNGKSYVGTDLAEDKEKVKATIEEKKKEQEPHTKMIVEAYKVPLRGSYKYEIERIEVKKYNIHNDGILYFCANRMYNKLKVNVHYPKKLLCVELKKCGTLGNFVIAQQTTSSTTYVCKGIVYPEQGYYINVKRKDF